MAKRTATLTKLLDKKGIKNVEDLSPEEKSVFDNYARILSKEVTVDSIKEFCQSQVKVIESACNGKDPLTMIQQAALHIYINILKVIEAPDIERENLEKYLNQEIL